MLKNRGKLISLADYINFAKTVLKNKIIYSPKIKML